MWSPPSPPTGSDLLVHLQESMEHSRESKRVSLLDIASDYRDPWSSPSNLPSLPSKCRELLHPQNGSPCFMKPQRRATRHLWSELQNQASLKLGPWRGKFCNTTVARRIKPTGSLRKSATLNLGDYLNRDVAVRLAGGNCILLLHFGPRYAATLAALTCR